jgi:hypothetical protein
MTIRAVAAAVLTLAAVTPAPATPAGDRMPDAAASHVVVDSYAGRSDYHRPVSDQRPVADHCAPRRHAVGWTSYSRRVVRRDYSGY